MSCKAVELLPPIDKFSFGSCVLKLFMEACLSIKFAYLDWLTCKKCLLGGHGKARRTVKPGFHIIVSVVSVVSVVRKKFIGQIKLYGNLPYKCSMQKK